MGQGKYSLDGTPEPSGGTYSVDAADASAESDDIAPVTLGDIMKNPRESIQRIGSILKQDATNPMNWITLATAYFGPKAIPKIAPVIKSAASNVARVRFSPKVAFDEASVIQPHHALRGFSLKDAAATTPGQSPAAPAQSLTPFFDDLTRQAAQRGAGQAPRFDLQSAHAAASAPPPRQQQQTPTASGPIQMPRLPERKSTIRAVDNVRPPSSLLAALTPEDGEAKSGMSKADAMAMIRMQRTPPAARRSDITLQPEGDPAFEQWYAEMAQTYPMAENPDDASQFYDFRAAFEAGASPDASGHWPSQFKKPGHPSEVVGGFDTRTGERVPGTPRASEKELIRLGWDAETAKQLARQPEPKGRS